MDTLKKEDTSQIGAENQITDTQTPAVVPDAQDVNEPELPIEPEPAGIDLKKTAIWSDDQVVEYYEKKLSDRTIASLNEDELNVVARHGQIAATRRASAEQAGFDAEREQIRRLVEVQVDRYAMASYLKGVHLDTLKNVRLGKDTPTHFEVVMRFGEREITLNAATVAAAFGNKNSPKVVEFERALNGLLQLTVDTASQQRSRIEKTKGKDYSGQTTDLRWRDRLDDLQAQDAG